MSEGSIDAKRSKGADDEGRKRLAHRAREAARRKRINEAVTELKRLTGCNPLAERSSVLELAVQLIQQQKVRSIAFIVVDLIR